MKALVDLNVLLDVLQRREPHYGASAAVLSRARRGELAAALPAHAVTTVYYLIARFAGRADAGRATDWLLANFEVVAADRPLYVRARALPLADFEDAVVAAAAERAACDRIVSRNVVDFAASPVPAVTPDELLAELVQRET